MPQKENFPQIIIGGLQRSGTSLIRAVIGSHPDIALFQWDLPLWIKFYPIYGGGKLSQVKAKELIREVLGHHKTKSTDMDFDENYFIKQIEERQDWRFSKVYQLFLGYYLEQTGRKYIGLKTPYNEFHTEAIFKHFPQTKFIHVLRSPLDAAVSLTEAKKKWWGGQVNYYAHIYHWQQSAQIAARNLQAFPNRYYVLKYEDFILNPEQLTREICDFLEVEFRSEMLEMSGQPGWKGGNSSFGSNPSKAKISASAIGRYKKRLEEKVQGKYFALLKEELATFDYPVESKSINGFGLTFMYRVNCWWDALKTRLIVFTQRSFFYQPLKKALLSMGWIK